jgi:hypothetical protein
LADALDDDWNIGVNPVPEPAHLCVIARWDDRTAVSRNLSDPASPDETAASLWTSNGSGAPNARTAASPYTGAAAAPPASRRASGAQGLRRPPRILSRVVRGCYTSGRGRRYPEALMFEKVLPSIEERVAAVLAKLPDTVAARLRQSKACMGFLLDEIPLTADRYFKVYHPLKRTEDELEPEERELLAAIRVYETQAEPRIDQDWVVSEIYTDERRKWFAKLPRRDEEGR